MSEILDEPKEAAKHPIDVLAERNAALRQKVANNESWARRFSVVGLGDALVAYALNKTGQGHSVDPVTAFNVVSTGAMFVSAGACAYQALKDHITATAQESVINQYQQQPAASAEQVSGQ